MHRVGQYSDVGDENLDTGCSLLQRIRHRRMRKRALHASLQNPKDLFWDAVWIQPEDIIREVTLYCHALPSVQLCVCVCVSVSVSVSVCARGSSSHLHIHS